MGSEECLVLNCRTYRTHQSRATLFRKQLIILRALNFSLGHTHWPPTQSNHPRSQGYMNSLARDRYRGIYHQPTSKSVLMFHQGKQEEGFLLLIFIRQLQFICITIYLFFGIWNITGHILPNF